MTAKAIELGVRAVMENNVYQFENKIRVQKEGGPIGVKLTGDISKAYMVEWDKEFLIKLERILVLWKMYCRYIDDQDIVTEAIKPGMRYNKEEDKMELKEELVELDKREDSDKRTFEAIKEISSSISEMIQLTADYPSRHPNKRLPILDVEMWIERDKEGYQQVRWSYFEKSMKNQFVIMKNSAFEDSKKRIVNTQEVIRRQRNCHPDLPKKEVAEILTKFSQKMKDSGYDEKFRYEVIDAGVKGYKEQVKKDKDGIRPMFRPRNYMKDERKEKKEQDKKDWYKKGGHTSVVEVEYTENSELAKRYREATKKKKVPWKVVEKSGYSLQNILVKSNPFKRENCGRQKCFPCKKPKGGDCTKIGAGYKIVCEECEDMVARYDGESGRNAYTRGIEHVDNYKNGKTTDFQKNAVDNEENRRKEKENPMWKHAREFHQDRKDVDFTMTVTGIFGRNNLKRQVNEHVRIAGNRGRTMNSKKEYNTPIVPTITINRSHIIG